MTTTTNGAIKLQFDAATGIATLTMEMDGPVNKINETLGLALVEAIDWAAGREGLKGVIVASGHKDFCVGADIEMLYQTRDAAALFEWTMGFNRALRKLETIGVPVVAALTGSALGGGYELALACHRRIAIDSPKARFGLPEVTLGVIPGGGGTQRLPRLVGFQAAADVILQGKMLRAPQAKSAGLVDELHPDAAAIRAAAEAFIADNPRSKQPWDNDRFRWPPPAAGTAAARDMILAGCAMVYKKTAGAYSAPEHALCAMQEGSLLKIDRALEVEVRHFVKQAVSDQCKDMLRTVWFHRTAAEKHEGLPTADDDRIGKIAILGAGMMGAGLAWVCANAGYEVVLRDIKQEQLDVATKHCETLTAKRAKHLDAAAKQALMARIGYTLELDPIAGSEMVIEAVFENLELKHRVIKETEPLLAEGGIFASNTSALPIGDLAQASAAPQRFIGLHFFSPVEQMQLLEIIQGEKTDDETIGRALAFCRKIKKLPILVGDGYGFYTTRVFSAYLLEGAQLVAEGHDPALIEWAARSAGMVIGPLQVFDEVTLTLGRKALEQGQKYLGHKLDYSGVALVKKMVDEHGRTGRADGAGFYSYENGRRRGLWEGLSALCEGTPDETGVELVAKRLLLMQCAEAARAVEAGVIQRYRDAEVGAVFGIGFAPNSGGPLSYMDRLGLRETVEQLRALAKQHGERYTPPKLLLEMADQGKTFFDPV